MIVSEFIKEVLTALLVKSDKTPGKSVRIGANEKCMQPYIDNDPIGLSAATNEAFQRFYDQGFIRIKWHNPGVLIQYIELTDADRLANEIGYIRLNARASNAVNLVQSSLVNSYHLEKLSSQLFQKWNLTGNYEGFSVDEPTILIEAIKAADGLLTLQSGQGVEIDERHFSSRVFSDSKKLKSIRGKVAKIMKLTQPDIPNELAPEDVLKLFGVVPIKHPIFVSGPIRVEASNGKTVIADFPPCIGLWPDSVQQLHLESPVDLITTIENQATFMRYVEQEKQGNELVLYTAGIPSPAVLRFYELLIEMDPHISLRHWGDIDVGGFIILNILEKHAQKSIEAYRMSPDSYAGKSCCTFMSSSEKMQLMKLALRFSASNKDAVIKAAELGEKFEQEGFY